MLQAAGIGDLVSYLQDHCPARGNDCFISTAHIKTQFSFYWGG